jgi:hypothetical protein
VISSYEVGAVFKIVDQATPVIAKLAQEARALTADIQALKQEIAGLGKTPGLTVLSRQLRSVSQSMRTATINAVRMGTTIQTSANTAANALAAVGAAGGVPAAGGAGGRIPPTGGRGRGGRHGPLSGWHVSGLSTRIPGGHMSFRGGSNVGMAAAGALAYGVYEESELEDATARMMLTIPGAAEDTGRTAARRQQIRDLLQRTASRTGAPLDDLEEAVLTGIRQFAGMDFDQRMQVMPGLLQAAAAEAKLKGQGTTVAAAMESMTGLAHMFQVYDPAGIAKMANAFAYISAIDPEKLPQIERAASYVIPRTRALEVDPMQELLLVGAMQRAGVRNTKAGTWISAMAMRAMPGTSVMSKTAFERHEKELREMGLIDDANKPTWFTDGKPDLIKLLAIAGTNAQKIPIERRGAMEAALFGTQGAGGFGVLADPKVYGQIQQLQKEMPGFRTGLPIFEQLDKDSPVQKAREAWGDLRNVLMDISTVALPPLIAALQIVDDSLKKIGAAMPKPGTHGSSVASGFLTGAILGGGAGFFTPIPGGVLGGALIGGLIGGFEGGRRDMLASSPGGGLSGGLLTTAANAATPGMHPHAAMPTMAVTIKVDPTDPGFLQKIARDLADLMHTASVHNQAQGQGALDSPFTAGGYMP